MDLLQWKWEDENGLARRMFYQPRSATTAHLITHYLSERGAACRRVRSTASFATSATFSCGGKCRRRAELSSPVKFKEQYNELSLRSSVALCGEKTTEGPVSAPVLFTQGKHARGWNQNAQKTNKKHTHISSKFLWLGLFFARFQITEKRLIESKDGQYSPTLII